MFFKGSFSSVMTFSPSKNRQSMSFSCAHACIVNKMILISLLFCGTIMYTLILVKIQQYIIRKQRECKHTDSGKLSHSCTHLIDFLEETQQGTGERGFIFLTGLLQWL